MALMYHAWDPLFSEIPPHTNEELAQLNLIELLHLVLLASVRPEDCRIPGAYMRSLTDPFAAEHAAKALAVWPDSFRDYLIQMQHAKSQTVYNNAYQSLSPILNIVSSRRRAKILPERVSAMILSQVLFVAKDPLALVSDAQALARIDATEIGLITLPQARAMFLGFRHRFDLLMAKGSIPIFAIWKGGTPQRCVLRSDVEAIGKAEGYPERGDFRKRQPDFALLAPLARYLGTEKVSLREIAARGLIRTAPSSSGIIYNRVDAALLIEGIETLCQPMTEGISFQYAAKRHHNMTIADLIVEVLKLNIRVSLSSSKAKGLNSFILDANDVAFAANNFDAYISFDRCAWMLGTTPQVVSALVRNGLLEASEGLPLYQRHYTEIALDSLHAFRSRWVLTNTLARTMNRATRVIEKEFNASGVACHARISPVLAVYEIEEAMAALGITKRSIL